MGVEIEAVELRRVALPLVVPFRTSFGVETTRDALLVRVHTDAGEGWGECVAMSEPTYSPEYVDGAEAVLRDHLVPRLLRRARDERGIDAEAVASWLTSVKGHPMAKAAVEAAVLDAQLRARATSFAAYLGGTRDAVEAGVSVGITTSIAELLDLVDRYVSDGYKRVKLKIEPGWDVEPVRAVRERFGEDLLLQVDANTAYDLADAPHLARLDPFGLLLIEQPLDERDLAGHARLASTIRTPICLDESIGSVYDAQLALDLGACSVVNIKPGRVGGYLEAKRIHDLCAARGVAVWCGGMLETGVGRAGNVALASLANFTLPGDLSASDRYFHRDITEPFALVGGCLTVPRGPGLGVDVDPAALAEVTTAVETIRAVDV